MLVLALALRTFEEFLLLRELMSILLVCPIKPFQNSLYLHLTWFSFIIGSGESPFESGSGGGFVGSIAIGFKEFSLIF